MEKKVYVVTINEVSDFEQFDHTPVVFSKREDAEKYLAQAKKEAIEDYEPDDKGESEEECGMCISADQPDYFALYEGNSWSETHYEVTIDECEIQ